MFALNLQWPGGSLGKVVVLSRNGSLLQSNCRGQDGDIQATELASNVSNDGVLQ
jgi:hypothetical protein